MSPLDMLIFLFFILVTIKAASSCIDYWKDAEEVVEVSAPKTVRTNAVSTQAHMSGTVRTARPSSVCVTPIKRVNTPAAASSRGYIIDQQTPLKEKGAA